MLDKIKNRIIIGILISEIVIGVKTKFEKASEKGAKYLSTVSLTLAPKEACAKVKSDKNVKKSLFKMLLSANSLFIVPQKRRNDKLLAQIVT